MNEYGGWSLPKPEPVRNGIIAHGIEACTGLLQTRAFADIPCSEALTLPGRGGERQVENVGVNSSGAEVRPHLVLSARGWAGPQHRLWGGHAASLASSALLWEARVGAAGQVQTGLSGSCLASPRLAGLAGRLPL